MLAFSPDHSTPPINNQSKTIEECFYESLVLNAFDSISISKIYLQQVPNVKSESENKPLSSRMARLKKAGLIGCLNDTEVTSSNYKKIIHRSFDLDSNT
jgi:hypothetical protein